MQMQLTTVNQWVHDQDEALEFYTEKLGMELRDDVTVPEMGNFRWLTVGPVGQPDIAVVLMAIPGPPVFEPETTAQLQDLVAKGASGGLFFADRRHPGDLRGAEGQGRRVHAGADAAAVRRRRRLPRPVGQPHPGHAERVDAIRCGRAPRGRGSPGALSRPRAGRRRTRAARAARSRRRHHGRRRPSPTGSSACAVRRPSSPARLRPSPG